MPAVSPPPTVTCCPRSLTLLYNLMSPTLMIPPPPRPRTWMSAAIIISPIPPRPSSILTPHLCNLAKLLAPKMPRWRPQRGAPSDKETKDTDPLPGYSFLPRMAQRENWSRSIGSTQPVAIPQQIVATPQRSSRSNILLSKSSSPSYQRTMLNHVTDTGFMNPLLSARLLLRQAYISVKEGYFVSDLLIQNRGNACMRAAFMELEYFTLFRTLRV